MRLEQEARERQDLLSPSTPSAPPGADPTAPPGVDPTAPPPSYEEAVHNPTYKSSNQASYNNVTYFILLLTIGMAENEPCLAARHEEKIEWKK